MSIRVIVNKSSEWAALPSGPSLRLLKLESSAADVKKHQEIVTTFLCIPGNPGNDRFYEAFGEHLLNAYADRTGHLSVRFLSIAHANHVPLPSAASKSATAHNSGRRYNLDDQIRLKLEFCEQFLAENVCGEKHRVYLIGHSIGAYISLRMLPGLLAAGWNVVSCFCLFPTVEQMAQTPCGRWIGPLANIVDHFDWFWRIPLALLQFLPLALKQWLCTKFLDAETPNCVRSAVAELANPLVIRNIAHMANHELQVVCDFDDSLLADDAKERVIFFYGRADQWAPLEFADRMQRRLPETGRVLVDSNEDGFEHAFVLRHSREMAILLVEMICDAA